MLSPADILIIGGVALLVFGPDQLPKVARNAGRVVRDVQSTSQAFIREMEFAADDPAPHRSAANASRETAGPQAPGEHAAGSMTAEPAIRTTHAAEPAIRTTPGAAEPPAG